MTRYSRRAPRATLADATAGIALPQKVDLIRRGKYGTVGTSGKAVVALRFDHMLDPFLTTVQPLLVARALPFSIGVVTRSVGNLSAGYEPTATTWATIKSSILAVGGEIWSHSCTHGDGVSLYDEIVTSKAEIEAQGIRVIGWQQPGGPATYGPAHTTVDAMDDEAGRLIRDTYGLYESSITGTNLRTIPTFGCWGYNHVTVDLLTLTAVKGWIDQAVQYGVGLELMLHPGYLDRTGGYMTTANYTAVLDYLVTLRDAGSLEVLTASGLAFADPGTTHRPSLTPFGDFEGQTTGSMPAPWNTSGSAWTIATDGGHSGSNYLHVPNTATVAICRTSIDTMGLDGHAFMFEGWTRSTDVGGATWRVQMTAFVPTTLVVRNVTGVVAQSSSWTRVRIPFCIPYGATSIAVCPGRSTGGSVDWDDIRCTAT